jgi:hypothetical protein
MQTKANQSPAVKVVDANMVKRVRRSFRKPVHRHNLKAKPFEITPFMIAPVLPGETLTSATFQSRVVTDPIENSLVGWSQEYYWFYVSHEGLHHWDTTGKLKEMLLEETVDLDSLRSSVNSTAYYTFNGAPKYMKACVEAIVDYYFRDEDESFDDATIDQYYAAQIEQESWMHSLKQASDGADDDELPGVDQQEELNILPGFETIYQQWEMMRDQGMEDVTYEDVLRSYGVSVPSIEEEDPVEKFKPEVLRFVRKWSYPSNTVNPADGSVASAVSWSFDEKITKKRFFKRPGFIVGLTVSRPKIYLGKQMGSAVGMLDDYRGWLPAVYNGLPYTSVQKETDSVSTGILQNQGEDYWLDVADLYRYGDQFVNHALDVAANHGIGMPRTTTKKYPTLTMVEAFFKSSPASDVRQDGVTFLNILSRLGPDTTG